MRDAKVEKVGEQSLAGRRWLQAMLTVGVFLISEWLLSCKQQLFSANSKENDSHKFSDKTRRFLGVSLFPSTVWLVNDLPNIPSGWCARKNLLF